MSEARELFEAVRNCLLAKGPSLYGKGFGVHGAACFIVADAIREALATQPEPAPMPELPRGVVETVSGHWHIHLSDGSYQWVPNGLDPDDLDRIAEACRILAARERARRSL